MVGTIDFDSEEEKEGEDENKVETKSLSELLPPDILAWLKGEGERPDEIKNLGDDVVSKINWFIMYVVMAQYERLPALFKYITALEAKRFDVGALEAITTLDDDDVKQKYKDVTAELTGILEFSRKFTYQNRELLEGTSMTEDERRVFEKIKQCTPETLKKIITTIDEAESGGEEK